MHAAPIPLQPEVHPTRRVTAAARARRACLAVALAIWAANAHAGVGLVRLAPVHPDGPVTVFYPTDAAPTPVHRGPFVFDAAEDAPPARGNGRLIVVSHGSGGTPWVYGDLARRLVDAGYVVAVPMHRGDAAGDDGSPGPDSWARRPGEVSRAIDAIAREPRFARGLALDRVGVYGMSAGGHTALTLAGGVWSPASFARHCDAHIADDFAACVPPFTRLTGGWADALKTSIARMVLRLWFTDDSPHAHHDPRIAAAIASVPVAAPFDPASLATPRVPLGLVVAGRDAWLASALHAERVLRACEPRCERIADLRDAGHGAMLSPMPPNLRGVVADLLADPPGFDRAVLPEVDRRIVGFFDRHLLGDAGRHRSTTAP